MIRFVFQINCISNFVPFNFSSFYILIFFLSFLSFVFFYSCCRCIIQSRPEVNKYCVSAKILHGVSRLQREVDK